MHVCTHLCIQATKAGGGGRGYACGTVDKMHSNPSAGSYVGNEMGVGGNFLLLVLHFVSMQKYYIVFSSIKTYPKTLLFF